MRTMAIAIMNMVDIAIIRAVARCPCPERSAGKTNKYFCKESTLQIKEQLTVHTPYYRWNLHTQFAESCLSIAKLNATSQRGTI